MAEPTPDAWRRVDTYLTETLVGHDADLESAVAEQNSAGLPAIEVAPVSGKLLHLLVRISGARRVLEIGTLGAYSTIWMARGIPDAALQGKAGAFDVQSERLRRADHTSGRPLAANLDCGATGRRAWLGATLSSGH